MVIKCLMSSGSVEKDLMGNVVSFIVVAICPRSCRLVYLSIAGVWELDSAQARVYSTRVRALDQVEFYEGLTVDREYQYGVLPVVRDGDYFFWREFERT